MGGWLISHEFWDLCVFQAFVEGIILCWQLKLDSATLLRSLNHMTILTHSTEMAKLNLPTSTWNQPPHFNLGKKKTLQQTTTKNNTSSPWHHKTAVSCSVPRWEKLPKMGVRKTLIIAALSFHVLATDDCRLGF